MSRRPMMRQSARSPGDGNSSPSISFLKLHHLFTLRQSKKVLLAASRKETHFGLGKQHSMGANACTGGDLSGNNRVRRIGYPIAGTEQVGHIIAVAQNGQVGLGISMELTTLCQPVYNRSNVFYSMYVSTWNIPKYREETTALWALLGTYLPNLQLVPLNVTNSGYLTPTIV